MSRNNAIQLCRCNLILHDYLFFATIKRGNISEAGEFIHNYSLAYALGWAKSEWGTKTQKPQYAQQLSKVRDIYATPANFLTGEHIIISCRTEARDYSLPAMPNPGSINYRVNKCFRPGSVFRFYVLARFHLDKIPPLVRLGKFMAKAEIVKQHPVKLEIIEGDCTVSSLLNWDDMAVKPSLCGVIIYALPGRLIGDARFSKTPYLKAEFSDGEVIELPLMMGYLREELCSTWWENAG
jgi:CRISPR-associated protein Csc1